MVSNFSTHEVKQEKISTKKKDQEKALIKLGGVACYPLSRECVKDLWVSGSQKLKNAVADRGKEQEREDKKLNIMFAAVRHFKTKMARNDRDLEIMTGAVEEGYMVEKTS